MKAKIINIQKVDFVGKDKKRIEYKKIGLLVDETINDNNGNVSVQTYPVIEPINVHIDSKLSVGDEIKLVVLSYKGKLKISIKDGKK